MRISQKLDLPVLSVSATGRVENMAILLSVFGLLLTTTIYFLI